MIITLNQNDIVKMLTDGLAARGLPVDANTQVTFSVTRKGGSNVTAEVSLGEEPQAANSIEVAQPVVAEKPKREKKVVTEDLGNFKAASESQAAEPNPVEEIPAQAEAPAQEAAAEAPKSAAGLFGG
ncbi:hypothetical protein [Pseudomonas phage LUZ7]|uniref:Uncharacterized protein n=1 Tax=Pseudomonas phage LUZ7 TaxID=655097 RepID=C8ZKG7_9CAUD|nr:hypothetical protein PP-LUZ7_gp068 [Pseudomonas phage LUZ7]CAZ66209.1 hypothetical protein [Pseudomonas phage LUZ7]